MVTIVLVISIVLNCGLAYAAIIGLNKQEVLETENERIAMQADELWKFIEALQEKIGQTLASMKALDDKQIFEKDDEVGVVFQGLADLVKELEAFLQPAVEQPIGENEIQEIPQEVS